MVSDLNIIATYGLADYARTWINQPRPEGYRRTLAKRACYRNAAVTVMDAAMNHRSLTYVEGFIFGIQHAWVIDRDGRVIDQTWTFQPAHEYVGVPFRREFLVRAILNRRGYHEMLHYANAIMEGWKQSETPSLVPLPYSDPATSIAEIVDLEALPRFDALAGACP